MAIEALFKKYFVAFVLLLVALVAYFQASGISHLIGAAVSLAPGDAAAAELPRARVAPQTRPTGKPILDRNPFDSVTGPLPKEEPPEPDEPGPVVVNDPLRVPRCGDVTVMIITESDDPLWSFAAVKGPGEEQFSLRRVGDKVGDQEVAYIGFNPVEGSPALWLEGTSLCQVLLFPTAEAPVAETKAPEPAKAAAPAKKDKRSIDPEIANKIKKVSDTEFSVDRSVVDSILENQAELMRSARIVPEQKDGKVVGVRLFGIRPDTLLGTLGLQNGDRLEAINGFDMGSPEKALEAYARLRTADNLKVQVNRRGKTMTIDFNIK